MAALRRLPMVRLLIALSLCTILYGCSPIPGASLPAVVVETSDPTRASTPTAMLLTPTALPDTPTPAPTDALRLCSPLGTVPIDELDKVVSAPYHPPPAGQEARHHGVDFAYYRRGDRLTIEGEMVQSVFDGRVAAAIQERMPYGNMLIIETRPEQIPEALRLRLDLKEGEALYLLYAHMGTPPGLTLVEQVHACQSIGEVGKSGNAAVAHLHLEARRGLAGASFPVMAYYDIEASDEEKAAYVRWRTGGEFAHFDPLSLFFP